MHAFLSWLAANPYVLLFFVIGAAVLLGKVTIKGYGLGMVASAIIVGAGLSAVAATMGITMKLDNFTKSLFYYLFMYGVGLRVGPSFFNSLKSDGLKFTILAVICSVMGLLMAVGFAKWFDLPGGAAAGVLAGSMTMSAAIGSAEEAVRQGAFPLAAGQTFEDISGMIALSYGLTYIWGTVGIILIVKYLPRMWGIDAKAAAREYEKENGVLNVDESGLSGYRPGGVRAYRLENPKVAGLTVKRFYDEHIGLKVVNVVRDGEAIGAADDIVFKLGDVIALGGKLEALTSDMGLVGPEVPDSKALNVPLDQAEILVTNKEFAGRKLKDFAHESFAGQINLQRIERGGVPIPIGLETEVRRFDLLFVTGLKSAVNRVGELAGKIGRASTGTDLLTLAAGMILGFLIGAISVPLAGANVGLGNAGGLLVSGILVSSVVSRTRFFGHTPNAARNILEDLGLIVFIAIVGINAGAGLISQLSAALTVKIVVAGFFVCTIPPIVCWLIGLYLMKIHPVVLMGGVAGARSHSGPAREAAVEVASSVPWVGFPVGYAVSGVLLTVFGYVAMIMSK
ncbi:aspartate:alanine exchanger family transporter [Rivibacter subsaxonicus]|uniref:Putative transport protein n=1 Tax=Rivibacter subsaxonicus TaxID=457575 RepID=A0A4Q7VN92_9BURK|nr:TrkA C-terminal domain-containing protein [Rivibacter subsaxonicus]RZT97813.1 putative transport protein [Rivibacter subsaxonicus]